MPPERFDQKVAVDIIVIRLKTLEDLITQRLDHMQQIIDERQAAADNAMELSNAEVQRRLELLNGEAARLREIQATYLPREVYEQGQDQIRKSIRILEDAATYQRGRGQVLSAIVATVVSLAVGLLSAIIARYGKMP